MQIPPLAWESSHINPAWKRSVPTCCNLAMINSATTIHHACRMSFSNLPLVTLRVCSRALDPAFCTLTPSFAISWKLESWEVVFAIHHWFSCISYMFLDHKGEVTMFVDQTGVWKCWTCMNMPCSAPTVPPTLIDDRRFMKIQQAACSSCILSKVSGSKTSWPLLYKRKAVTSVRIPADSLWWRKARNRLGWYTDTHGHMAGFSRQNHHTSQKKKISTPSGKRCLIRRVTLQSNHPFSQVFETAARWLANAKVSQIQKLWSSEMLKKIRAKKDAKRALLKDSATSKASSIIFQGKILKYIRCLLLLWMHSIYIDLNSIYIYYIIYTCEKSTGISIYKIIIITQKNQIKLI